MSKTFENIKTPEFWRKAWQEARNSSDVQRKRIRSEAETKEFWNRFAARYEKRSTPREGRDRVKAITGLLKNRQIITPQTRILDVGSGPGTYALPFAKICKDVVALDNAEKMCKAVEEKAASEGLTNIRTLNRNWEEIDPVKEGLAKSFDLVFASLVPAISDMETLNKMTLASKKDCCLVTWASEAHSRARRDLWKLIFKESYEGRGQSILFPFNLLFSMGYFPSISYFDSDHNYSDPVDEAIERLISTFWLFTEISDEIRNIITSYVRERAVDGIFTQETAVKLGIITWETETSEG